MLNISVQGEQDREEAANMAVQLILLRLVYQINHVLSINISICPALLSSPVFCVYDN